MANVNKDLIGKVKIHVWAQHHHLTNVALFQKRKTGWKKIFHPKTKTSTAVTHSDGNISAHATAQARWPSTNACPEFSKTEWFFFDEKKKKENFVLKLKKSLKLKLEFEVDDANFWAPALGSTTTTMMLMLASAGAGRSCPWKLWQLRTKDVPV